MSENTKICQLNTKMKVKQVMNPKMKSKTQTSIPLQNYTNTHKSQSKKQFTTAYQFPYSDKTLEPTSSSDSYTVQLSTNLTVNKNNN